MGTKKSCLEAKGKDERIALGIWVADSEICFLSIKRGECDEVSWTYREGERINQRLYSGISFTVSGYNILSTVFIGLCRRALHLLGPFPHISVKLAIWRSFLYHLCFESPHPNPFPP